MLKPDELHDEIGPCRQRGVALGFRTMKVRERFMSAIVLAEDERRRAATLKDQHVIRLRERDARRMQRKRTIETRGPEEARTRNTRVREEQIVAFALVCEKRRRHARRKNERTPWATAERQRREPFTRLSDARGVEQIHGERQRTAGRERVARATADPRNVFPDVQPPSEASAWSRCPTRCGERSGTLRGGADRRRGAVATKRQEHVAVRVERVESCRRM